MLLRLGRNIKKIREHLGYTKSELAVLVGCKQETISSWEKNSTTPRVDKLIKLSVVLNIPLGRLIDGIDLKTRSVLTQILFGLMAFTKGKL